MPGKGKKHLRQAFKKFDKDGDGFLNADELKAYLKSVDANGDLTEQELKDGTAFLDKNKDGKVNMKEFIRACKKQSQKHGSDSDSN